MKRKIKRNDGYKLIHTCLYLNWIIACLLGFLDEKIKNFRMTCLHKKEYIFNGDDNIKYMCDNNVLFIIIIIMLMNWSLA